jgi:hypothetical protein
MCRVACACISIPGVPARQGLGPGTACGVCRRYAHILARSLDIGMRLYAAGAVFFNTAVPGSSCGDAQAEGRLRPGDILFAVRT